MFGPSPNISGVMSVRSGVDANGTEFSGALYYKSRGVETDSVSTITVKSPSVLIGFDSSRLYSLYSGSDIKPKAILSQNLIKY